MDEKMMALNTGWLFFIVTLPFSTGLLSTHFGDAHAVFLYSCNVFFLSVFQNFIWGYAGNQEGFTDKDKLSMNEHLEGRIRLMLNLDMLNGLIALVMSFFLPKTAFFLLFFKVPLFIFATIFIAAQRRNNIIASQN